ncbi:MAG: hypothetical protein OXN15_03045 [Chloroflexota bacterium]|nr:hypothetical protein [Dehalococcoidia bacterium]MDE2899988.1 hypothetical protein [Chloroflexota bacterium]
MKRVSVCALALTVVLLSCTVTKSEVQQAETETADAPIEVRVTAEQLYEDYEKNEISANLKYDDKILAVTGQVSGFGGGSEQAYYLDLSTGDAWATVRCHFSDARVEELTALNRGDIVTLRGKGDEGKDRDPFTIDIIGCSVFEEE